MDQRGSTSKQCIETLISSILEKLRAWTGKEEMNNFDPTDHKGRGLDDVKTGDPP